MTSTTDGNKRWHEVGAFKLLACVTILAIAAVLIFRPDALPIREVMAKDQFAAWVTLLAAFIGFGAIAYQTSKGFDHLIASQKNQAEIDRLARDEQAERDREARMHQAAIARNNILDDRIAKRKALAAALCGELGAITLAINISFDAVKMMIIVFEHFGETKLGPNFDVTWPMPKIDPIVYKANIADLGLLGPSTAGDVVQIYQLVLTARPPIENSSLTGTMASKMFGAQHEHLKKWVTSSYHVQQRLLSQLGDSTEDPGPLFFMNNPETIAATEKTTTASGSSLDP
ncbi:hypothetical protein FHS21_002819 [Phyllobacterium trifolii]|uniref:Uncharacterized protein n=1 Tax=Phyllobacterium trifolii TaxID=300193 RepID=A0A839U8V6_9HYPH|nr:hypothetical protein [Phyllobacterium trifolii]MBB3146404.1 hypothetical protein [Phyllobacterium trifolii]